MSSERSGQLSSSSSDSSVYLIFLTSGETSDLAGDEDVLVLHLDVIQLLESVLEESSHSSYRATNLEGLENKLIDRTLDKF